MYLHANAKLGLAGRLALVGGGRLMLHDLSIASIEAIRAHNAHAVSAPPSP